MEGGRGGHFAHGKFKFKLFLNGLWYEPETLWLFLTFTSDCFTEKKIQKYIKFSGGNISLPGVLSKIRVRICKNSFSRGIKYLHVEVVVSTKRLCSVFCWPAIIIYRPTNN